MTAECNTVIIGSGIVGVCTAYFLSQSGNTRPESICLVDSGSKLFNCASGYAGGFLARDWFAPSVASLGSLSYKLHKELADKHNGRQIWGYASSTCTSLSQSIDEAVGGSGEDWLSHGTSRANTSSTKNASWTSGPQWLRREEGNSLEVISEVGATAQVDPLRFCQWMLEEVKKRGVQVHHPARPLCVGTDADGQLSNLRVRIDGSEKELPCTHLVLTSGAWTPRLFKILFPKSSTQIPVAYLAGHSLLLKNPYVKTDQDEICHAVFATDNLGFSPEYFARLGGEIYLAGLNSTMIPLPESTDDVKLKNESISQMKECAGRMLEKGESKEDLVVTREALCFRPITNSGRPLLSRIADNKLGGVKTKGDAEGGVFISAGHGAWGISQAPGTGLCLAELVEGRKTSANIEALVLN